MADATEDILPLDQDVDLSDETQDFRFLSHLASYDSTSTALPPRRGEKDFEPNPTISQSNALDSARQAMHAALSYPRLHLPKHHVVGTFDAETGKTAVQRPKGTFTRTMGVAQRDRLLLLPEEALYLLERGSLDVRWPLERGGEGADGEVPMSLQGAYAAMMGTDGLTMERFVVYSGLKRAGYTVVRAPTWSEEGVPLNYDRPLASGSREQGSSVFSLIPRLFNWLRASSPKSCPLFGPLVAPGLYRNYNDIYRALTLIPHHESSIPLSESPNRPAPPYRVTYHVWKPSTTYRKTSPPHPDYHFAVINARTTSTPTLAELSALLDTTPYAPPNTGGHVYARLKHGWRNVTLAIVDQGVVSYLRLSDAGFGNQKLYELKQSTGGKRSGPGRGGYRGGHRGGRGKR